MALSTRWPLPSQLCRVGLAIAISVTLASPAFLYADAGASLGHNVLNQCDSTLSAMTRVRMVVQVAARAERNADRSGSKEYTEVSRDTSTIAIVRDGEAWRVTSYKSGRINRNGETQPVKYGVELVNAEAFLRIQMPEWTTQGQITDLPGAAIYGDLDPGNKHERDFWSATLFCAPLFGRVIGADVSRLTELLRDEAAEASFQEVALDDRPAVHATGKGKYGEHQAWFDPDNGFLPRRIEVAKRLGDWFDAIEVGTSGSRRNKRRRSKGGQENEGSDKPKFTGTTLVIKDVVIEKRGEVPYISGFNFEQVSSTDDGASRRDAADVRILELEFPEAPLPPEAFRPSVEIPEGTPVSVSSEPMIRYAWSDGAITKVLDDQIGNKVAFIPPRPRRPMFWIVLLNVFLVLVACFPIFRRTIGKWRKTR